MSWLGWVAVIASLSFLTYVVTIVYGLFRRNADLTQEKIDELERKVEIESGVIKNNAEADNAVTGSDLDKRVLDKYGGG